MRELVVAATLLASGCGRFRFDDRTLGDGGSATDDTNMPSDACADSKWSVPVLIPGPVQSTADDWAPSVTGDGLQIFFHSYRSSATAQLFVATRLTTADNFGAAGRIMELTSTDQLFGPTVSGDGRRLVFADSAPGNFKLFEATRASTGVPWQTPTVLANINGSIAVEDTHPSLSPDGLRIVWASTRFGPEHTIAESTRPNLVTAFGAPVFHTELDEPPANIFSPALSSDGLELYYSSTKAGSFDVYRATRPNLTTPFGPPVLVQELSSATDDVGIHFIDDETMVLNYAAMTMGGNADLFITTRCL